MLPAQQGLEAGDGLAPNVLLRLIHQAQFVARDREPQIMFQQSAFADLGAHPCFEETIGVAAFALGAVERGVGMGEKRLTIRRVVRTERDADAASR